jgi:predicted metalloprotease with PDZ domain
VVALVLDLHLRRHGSALSVVLRRMWHRFGRWEAGYREDDLLALFEEQAADLSTLLPQWLRSPEDPAIDDYFADVGLCLEAEQASLPFLGWQLDQPPEGGLRLKQVSRQGPAEAAGLEVGDELIALGRRRVRKVAEVEAALTGAGSPLALLVCRQGLVRETTLTPQPAVVQRWRLRALPQASAAALDRRRRWLELVP